MTDFIPSLKGLTIQTAIKLKSLKSHFLPFDATQSAVMPQ